MDESGDHTRPDPPTWEQVEYNCLLILESSQDPEGALNFSLTKQEAAFVIFATQTQVMLIPELGIVALRLLRKFTELSEAQGFTDIPHELKVRLGMELPLDDDFDPDDYEGGDDIDPRPGP
jgi:hypothetical protein